MIQLYFLSVLCNGLGGYILFAGDENGKVEKQQISINNPVFTLVLGIISAVTGVLKLLSPTTERFPVLGDLVPSAAGIIAGLILIFGIYRRNKNESPGALDRTGTSLLLFRKPLGLALLAAALAHFLFPQALFL